MKLIELFEQNYEGGYASKSMTWSSLAQAVPRLQTALSALDNGVHIWRGVQSQGDVRFKPHMPAGYRVSRNTDNYYTLFMDGDPSWAAYPRRSASMIASTSISTAKGYGGPYLLLPEGDPKVGVCSTSDLWTSFENLSDKLGSFSRIWDLSDLNSAISRAAIEVMGWPLFEPADYMELVHDLQQIQDAYNHQLSQGVDPLSKYAGAQQLFRYKPDQPVELKLRELLDPHANNFALTSWSTLDAYSHHNYEVWFSAPVWMISHHVLPAHGQITQKIILDVIDKNT